jgi:hypothetical protein
MRRRACVSNTMFKGDRYETQSTRIRVCGSSLSFVVSPGSDRRPML